MFLGITKTQVTLAISMLVAAGNALVPFMSPQVSAVVVVVLGAIAMIFHVSDTNQAVAAASAK